MLKPMIVDCLAIAAALLYSPLLFALTVNVGPLGYEPTVDGIDDEWSTIQPT